MVGMSAIKNVALFFNQRRTVDNFGRLIFSKTRENGVLALGAWGLKMVSKE